MVSIMNPHKNYRILFFIYIILSLLKADQVKTTDIYRTAFQVSTFLYLEFGLDYNISNNNSNTPNTFDTYFRNKFRWKNKQLKTANSLSDILLYASLCNSLTLTPLFSKNEFLPIILTNLDIISINGIVTDIVKIISKRQRPSSYYQTVNETNEGFRSFFSGHTSTAFALWVSTTTFLSESFSDNSRIIWGIGGFWAASIGYLRIAADKHYMTDVITGALAGFTIAKLILKRNKDRYFYFGIDPGINESNIRIGIKF